MKFGERKQTQGAQQAQEPWSETAGNAPRTAGAAAAETAPHGSEGRRPNANPGTQYEYYMILDKGDSNA